MYRILVVDDEENIREVIKEYAEFEGHQVSEACDGMQAVEMVKNNDYDIIIMDVMMPRLDGYSACKEIRKIKQIPVLMLSARGEEYDKLFGFELGIDDYVVKPFSPKEVMARVNAIVKRNSGAAAAAAPAPETVKFGGLEINFTSRDVYIDGVKANLTPKEYDLLFYLGAQQEYCAHPEQIAGRGVGIRFLRRRPHDRHAYQDAAQQSRSVSQLHRNSARYGVQVRG